MIKNALKNFFKNLIYVFVPMGIVYLVLLITFFALVGGLVQYAGTMLGDVADLVQTSVGESSASVNAFFAEAADKLMESWNGNLWTLFRTIFETKWLRETVVGFFGTLNESSAGFETQLTEIIGTFKNHIIGLVSGVAVFCVVGIFFANFVTRFVVRRRTAKRGFKKFFLARTVVPVVQVLLLVATCILFSLIKLYSLFVVILFVLMMTAIAFISSWIVHRDGNLKLKDVLTFKNVMKHLAAIGIILLINVLLAVVLFLLNPLLAILIMIPVILYSLNIADLNTDAIVCKLIEDKKAAASSAEEQEAPAGASEEESASKE